MTPNPQTTPIFAFFVVFHIFVVSKHRDFIFGISEVSAPYRKGGNLGGTVPTFRVGDIANNNSWGQWGRCSHGRRTQYTGSFSKLAQSILLQRPQKLIFFWGGEGDQKFFRWFYAPNINCMFPPLPYRVHVYNRSTLNARPTCPTLIPDLFSLLYVQYCMTRIIDGLCRNNRRVTGLTSIAHGRLANSGDSLNEYIACQNGSTRGPSSG